MTQSARRAVRSRRLSWNTGIVIDGYGVLELATWLTVWSPTRQAWTTAEESPPLGWQLTGLYRFDDLWVGLAEGPRVR